MIPSDYVTAISPPFFVVWGSIGIPSLIILRVPLYATFSVHFYKECISLQLLENYGDSRNW